MLVSFFPLLHFLSSSEAGCVCEEGYSGDECDVIDSCNGVDCGPGGACEEANTLPEPHLEPVHWTAGLPPNSAIFIRLTSWIMLQLQDDL